MHEFSICQGIVDAAVDEMRKLDSPRQRLIKARVVVGALRQIVPEYLTFAYETLTKETPAEGSTLDIVQPPLTGRCPECDWEGTMLKPRFQCTQCGSYRIEMTGGTELYLESLEVEEDE